MILGSSVLAPIMSFYFPFNIFADTYNVRKNGFVCEGSGILQNILMKLLDNRMELELTKNLLKFELKCLFYYLYWILFIIYYLI